MKIGKFQKIRIRRYGIIDNIQLGNREPDIVTGNDGTQNDAVEDNINKAGINGNKEDFEKQLQDDYNEMVTSVYKYGGFYVSRYEISLSEDGKKVQYKKGMKSLINDDNMTGHWYEYYKRQREFVDVEKYGKNLRSSMIWGSQYDAMMNWMAREGKDITSLSVATKNKLSTRITGGEENDKILNVYDLQGNSYEWTLECNLQLSRSLRGGAYNNDYTAIYRSQCDSAIAYSYLSSRGVIYLI